MEKTGINFRGLTPLLRTAGRRGEVRLTDVKRAVASATTVFRRIGSLAMLLSVVSLVADVAPIDGGRLGESFRILQVRFEAVVAPGLRGPDQANKGDSYAPDFKLLAAAELDALGALGPQSETGRTIAVRRGAYFDLWSQYEGNIGDAIPHAARLSFEIVGGRGDSAYLLLGNDDCCVVFVDGRAVWGVAGVREQIEAENAVRIPLVGGSAKVDVVSWKQRDWTRLPDDRFVDSWSVNLTLCGSEAEAWAVVMGKSCHFLETPVVRVPGDFHSKVHLGGYSEVAFYDLEGSLVARSRVLPSGEIAPPDKAFAEQGFVGFAVLANTLAEAMVVTGDRPIDERAEEVLRTPNQLVLAAGSWEYRCRHLFKPQFRNDRDVWWARKAALSMATVGMHTKIDRERMPFRLWRSSLLEFGEYISKIDGTRQYYRTYAAGGAGVRPLAVILRGIPSTARPFLESYTIADLKAAEEMLVIAQETGCDLLWPGDVDVDYGGNFVQAWAREGVEAFSRDHPANGSRPIYSVGFCSGAVAAIRYAEVENVDGLVLWTSVANRPTYRWPIVKADQWPMLPASVMDAEATANNRKSLRRIPIFVLFDHKEPGHGDWPGTAALCRELESLGGTIEEEWVQNPDRRLVWGMRATVGEHRWMQWIAAQTPTRRPVRANSRAVGTMKDALLQGFVIEPTSDPVAEGWLKKWSETLLSYRGETPRRENMPPTATRIMVRALSGDAFLRELSKGFSAGAPQLPTSSKLAEAAAGYTQLFGLRLGIDNSDQIEVWCDARGGTDGPPAVDLFCEGCCVAGLWGLSNGRWELIQAWL